MFQVIMFQVIIPRMEAFGQTLVLSCTYTSQNMCRSIFVISTFATDGTSILAQVMWCRFDDDCFYFYKK